MLTVLILREHTLARARTDSTVTDSLALIFTSAMKELITVTETLSAQILLVLLLAPVIPDSRVTE